MLWGDEVEYLVVTYSQDDPKVLLSLRQADILTALAADEELSKKGGGVPAIQETKECQQSNPLPVFHPEFGRFMLEATPGKPWGIGFKELLGVESDMKIRYGPASSLWYYIHGCWREPLSYTRTGEKLPRST